MILLFWNQSQLILMHRIVNVTSKAQHPNPQNTAYLQISQDLLTVKICSECITTAVSKAQRTPYHTHGSKRNRQLVGYQRNVAKANILIIFFHKNRSISHCHLLRIRCLRILFIFCYFFCIV